MLLIRAGKSCFTLFSDEIEHNTIPMAGVEAVVVHLNPTDSVILADASSGLEMDQQDEDDAKTKLENYYLYVFQTGNEI